MHIVPCCGPGSAAPDVSPPDRELAEHVQQVTEQWSASLSKLGMKTVDQVADENTRLRALLQKAHDELAKTDHWYHSDIKEELAKELGL